MKRALLYGSLLVFATMALLPWAAMMAKTVTVDEVDISLAGEPPPAHGHSAGVVLDVSPHTVSESRLKIDVEEIISARYRIGDKGPFAEGQRIYFMPAMSYFKEDPNLTLTVYRDEPVARQALWSRGTVVSASAERIGIDVEKFAWVVVPNSKVAEKGLAPGLKLRYSSRKKASASAYIETFSDAKRLKLLLDTLAVALLTVLASGVIGTFFAVATAKINTPWRRLLSVLYVVPLLVPPYIAAIAWTLLLGAKGVLSEALQSVFGWQELPYSIYGLPGSVLVLSLSFFPIFTLMVSAGLRNMSSDAEEAALLSSGRMRTILFVSLRSIKPYLLSAAVFVFSFTLSSSAVPFLMRFQVFSGQVLVAFQTDMSGAQAMAVGVPLQLLALGAVVLQGAMENRRGEAASAKLVGKGLVIDAGPWRWAAWAVSLIVIVLSAGVPIGMLAYMTKSPENLRLALVEMGPEIKNSLWISAAAATLAVAVGSAVGWLSARARGGRGTLIEILVMLPYATPAAVLGAGMIEVFNRPGLLGAVYASEAILIWTFLVRFMPFAVKPVASAVKAVNPELEEAAAAHGVGPLRTVAGVTLRLSAKGIAAGWILVFILSLGELDAALLVHPAGCQTMPIRIFNAIHFGHVELVCGLCLILVFAISLPLAVYCLLTARKPEIL